MADFLLRIGRHIRSFFQFNQDVAFSSALALLSGVGALASIKQITDNALILGIFSLCFLSCLVQIARRVLGWWRLPYTEIWANMRQAHRWIRRRLTGNPILPQLGVNRVLIVGVAVTDIGRLFECVARAVSQGVTFYVYLMSPDSPHVSGALKRFEREATVSKVVQEPLVEDIKGLERLYNRQEAGGLVRKLRALRVRLEDKDCKDHAECINVCEELWILAGRKGLEMMPDGGNVKIYHLQDLPFAKQWLFGDKALLYSTYVGHPGVGVDNPVFCYSAFERAEASTVVARAEHYVEGLHGGCQEPVREAKEISSRGVGGERDGEQK